MASPSTSWSRAAPAPAARARRAAPRRPAAAAAAAPAPAGAPEWGVALRQGPRDAMEDMAEVTLDAARGMLIATVFDGHAGGAAVAFLRGRLHAVLAETLEAHAASASASDCDDPFAFGREEGVCCPVELRGALAAAYAAADAELLEWLASPAHAPGGEAASGATATTLVLRPAGAPDRVVVANVGDSRAVLVRGGGAVDLSTEHRVHGRGGAVAAEAARVAAAGGWVEDGRVLGMLAVSRAFGDREFKRPALAGALARGAAEGHWPAARVEAAAAAAAAGAADPVTAEPDVLEAVLARAPGRDEALIVATDGVWDVMGSAQAAAAVRAELARGRGAQAAADRLADLALKRYTADNVGVVVVDLLGAAAWAAAAPPPRAKVFGLF
jgi:serine/threonine protein phosphatase PrpC